MIYAEKSDKENEVLTDTENEENQKRQGDIQQKLNLLVGPRLQKIREKIGYSQEDAGDLMGLGKATVSRHEGGGLNLTAPILAKYSQIYHVSLDELVRGLYPEPEGKVFYQIRIHGEDIPEESRTMLDFQVKTLQIFCCMLHLNAEITFSPDSMTAGHSEEEEAGSGSAPDSDSADGARGAPVKFIEDLTDEDLMLLKCLWDSDKPRSCSGLMEEIRQKFNLFIPFASLNETIRKLTNLGLLTSLPNPNPDRDSEADDSLLYRITISEVEFRRM